MENVKPQTRGKRARRVPTPPVTTVARAPVFPDLTSANGVMRVREALGMLPGCGEGLRLGPCLGQALTNAYASGDFECLLDPVWTVAGDTKPPGLLEIHARAWGAAAPPRQCYKFLMEFVGDLTHFLVAHQAASGALVSKEPTKSKLGLAGRFFDLVLAEIHLPDTASAFATKTWLSYPIPRLAASDVLGMSPLWWRYAGHYAHVLCSPDCIQRRLPKPGPELSAFSFGQFCETNCQPRHLVVSVGNHEAVSKSTYTKAREIVYNTHYCDVQYLANRAPTLLGVEDNGATSFFLVSDVLNCARQDEAEMERKLLDHILNPRMRRTSMVTALHRLGDSLIPISPWVPSFEMSTYEYLTVEAVKGMDSYFRASLQSLTETVRAIRTGPPSSGVVGAFLLKSFADQRAALAVVGTALFVNIIHVVGFVLSVPEAQREIEKACGFTALTKICGISEMVTRVHNVLDALKLAGVDPSEFVCRFSADERAYELIETKVWEVLVKS